MDITEFLLARIAEDEASAAYSDEDEREGGYIWSDVGANKPVLTVGTDRILRECAAKRAIIEAAEESPGALSYLNPLAAVYSDHPDYQQEWSL